MRRVPEDFKFDTKLPSRILFELYCLGDLNTQIGPYRYFETKDFARQNERSRLSDMLALMRPAKAALEQRQQWVDRPRWPGCTPCGTRRAT